MSRDTDERRHAVFRDVVHYLRPRSLLVLNDTRVIPARLRAAKPSGGRIEILLTRRVSVAEPSPGGAESGWEEDWQVLVRSLGSSPPGTQLSLAPDLSAEILSRGERGVALLRFRGRGAGGLLAAAEGLGAIPLPPYIEAARKQEADASSPPVDDRSRYQTVFARVPGAVAAPTAGLHFTEGLLESLEAAGHEVARITLHVGPGTFRPVEMDDPRAHQMDSEWYEVPQSTAEAVRRARAAGRPIVAVGTTVVRALESAAAGGEIMAGSASTDLFLLPGAEFRVVTDLVTNFHLPRSTLLMLVAAFAGRERVLAAYEDAVAKGYRFYSYGDAMFIRPGALPS